MSDSMSDEKWEGTEHPLKGYRTCVTCVYTGTEMVCRGCLNNLTRPNWKHKYTREDYDIDKEWYDDHRSVLRDAVAPGHDPVTNPKHYQLFGKYQVLDLVDNRVRAMATALYGTQDYGDPPLEDVAVIAGHYKASIEYLMRWPLKNGVEDLKKCRTYLDMMIEELSDA